MARASETKKPARRRAAVASRGRGRPAATAAKTRTDEAQAAERRADSVPAGPESRPDAIAASVRQLEAVAASLAASAASLGRSLADAPKASDFEPLAEHLYEFARAGSLRALQEAVESLQATQASFAEALFHMPRVAEYEPLAAPLREFALLLPAFVDRLNQVPQAAAPLADAVRDLRELADALRPNAGAVAERAAPGLPAPPAGASREPGLAEQVASARDAVLAALESLPGREDYAPVAAQLRELASVSPSLMDWLREVPRLSMPLADSIEALKRTAATLDGIQGALRQGGGPNGAAEAAAPKTVRDGARLVHERLRELRRSLQAGAAAGAGLPEVLDELRRELDELETVLADRIANPGIEPLSPRGPGKT
jgi:hypothetical protein